MPTNRLRPMAFRFAIGSVLGAALLVGTAYGDARAKSASEQDAVQLKRSDEKAVGRAEQAVAKSPQDGALRAALGQAYLRTGRFTSATAAFTDALTLGDNSARTTLGLALANIANGRNREAIAILESVRGSVPASDFGLALALAGQTDRGVAILADALRRGDNSPKLRQNLAYAYALNGSWREARIMMTQDVPAEQLNARLTQWAASGRPDLFHQRVAALLGAPVRADTGMPQQLALNVAPTIAAPANAEALAAPAPVAELPPVEQAVAAAPEPAPAPMYVAETAPAPAPIQEFVPALSGSTGNALTPPAPGAPANNRSLAAFDEFARPVANALTVNPARAAVAASPRSWTAPQPSAEGNHVVQLGSFTTEQSARRAWNVLVSRNPGLKNARMVITPALVNGRKFWRVAAASYDRLGAQGVCSGIKARGGACFSYATSGPRRNILMARTEVRSSAGLALR